LVIICSAMSIDLFSKRVVGGHLSSGRSLLVLRLLSWLCSEKYVFETISESVTNY
jgi:hypothetical protein